MSFSVCVREQTRELRPTAGPEAGSETAGSLRAGGGQSGSAADGSGLSGLRVPTQSAAGMPAESGRRRRGGQRYAQVFNRHNGCSLTTNTLAVMKYCCVSSPNRWRDAVGEAAVGVQRGVRVALSGTGVSTPAV